MKRKEISVLLVEDNRINAKLIKKILDKDKSSPVDLECVETLVGAVEHLKSNKVSIVLLDLNLPDSQELETLTKVRAAAPDVPIVILTGVDDESVAIKAMRQGAQDYLVKGQVNTSLMLRIIRYAIERNKMTKALKDNRAELQRHRDKLEKTVKERTAKLVEITKHLQEEILERKSASEKLVKANRSLKTISSSNRAIVWTKTEKELLKRICEIIVNVGGHRFAWVGFYEDEEQDVILPKSYSGEENGFLETISLKWNKDEENPIFDTMRIGIPSVIEDISTAATSCWAKEALKRGYMSSIFLPLVSGKNNFGTLNIYSSEKYAFNKEEEKLLSELADDVAYAIMAFRTDKERRRAKDTIERLEFHDPLTGLPNWRLFNQTLSKEVEESQSADVNLAVMFLDLNRLKDLNDALGHSIVDELLKKVAKRLQRCTRDCDMVARLKGDEFAIVIPKIKGGENTAILAKRILRTLNVPFYINNRKLYVTAGIGIAIYPKDGINIHYLLKNADTAMHHAKKQEVNSYRFYNPEMTKAKYETVALKAQVREGIEKEEFLVYYQPKISLITGKMTGMEALIRWNHPTLGIVPPGKFIPLAEESGLIVPMGEFVLNKACQQNKAWQEQGLPCVRVAVNLSAQQFKNKMLSAVVGKTLERTGLDPKWLELEITESEIIQNAGLAFSTLKTLNRMGIQISLDDFGTGYSSLSYLKNLPINTLKIDYSFIRDIMIDEDSAEIVKAIIAMSHSLKLKVVAEGVETKEQLEFLRTLKHGDKCDEVQGFFFSKPLTSEEFEKVLKEKNIWLPD